MTYKEIILTVALVILLSLISFIIKKGIEKFSILQSIELHRKKIITTLSHILLYILGLILLLPIWGVDFKQMIVFVSSILAVLGVGFFAQWSLLSNLTASVILFFNHPVRIGNRIRIIEKDYDWCGVVQNITGFYFYIITDKGEHISLPNSLVIQKGIEILQNNTNSESENHEINTKP